MLALSLEVLATKVSHSPPAAAATAAAAAGIEVAAQSAPVLPQGLALAMDADSLLRFKGLLLRALLRTAQACPVR